MSLCDSVADVKPSNILLGFDGTVKLADFGIAGYLQMSMMEGNEGCQIYLAVSSQSRHESSLTVLCSRSGGLSSNLTCAATCGRLAWRSWRLPACTTPTSTARTCLSSWGPSRSVCCHVHMLHGCDGWVQSRRRG